jgi:hypothetical protein
MANARLSKASAPVTPLTAAMVWRMAVYVLLILPLSASSQTPGEPGSSWAGFNLMLSKTLTILPKTQDVQTKTTPVTVAQSSIDAPIPRAKSTLPLLDGSKTRGIEQPQDELTLPSIPNARELFDMVVSCWPEKSFFRGELSLEGRATRTHASNSTTSTTTTFDPVTGSYSSSHNNYIALVGKIPLYSGIELDREREREASRRTLIANAVGVYISALAEHKLNERELQLLRALEARAKQRVDAGVTETKEQLGAFEKVSTLENKNIKTGADLIKSRVQLSAMCDDKRAWIIDGYLKKFNELN